LRERDLFSYLDGHTVEENPRMAAHSGGQPYAWEEASITAISWGVVERKRGFLRRVLAAARGHGKEKGKIW